MGAEAFLKGRRCGGRGLHEFVPAARQPHGQCAAAQRPVLAHQPQGRREQRQPQLQRRRGDFRVRRRGGGLRRHGRRQDAAQFIRDNCVHIASASSAACGAYRPGSMGLGSESPCPRRGSFEAEDLLSNHRGHEEEEERRQQCVDELGDQVQQLQGQVAALSESLASNGDLYRRVKQENATLVHRIHNLEEQIRELEVRSEERAHEEERRLKDALSRQERESALELERCGAQLRSLQQEQRALQEEALRLRTLAERLKVEKEQALEQLDQSQAQLSQLREEHQRLQEMCRREREESQAQRTLQAQLLQEVGRELEELRRLRTDRDGRPRSPSLLDLLPARCLELQGQLESVREENRALREANEELQAQLLSSHVHEGQCLVAGGGGHRSPDGAASLATEFSNLEELSKEKLIDTVKHEKEDNVRLRAYIDGILLNIIENHPQLLEVKQLV
ncbi:hypothetical protein V5799_010856 [Amblyomma americanum]|uniref:FIP-RBD domain-containing protein n=2 Tax=Amblyomma TaxID=6942 RepID=A0AAQ4EIJ3_AMBAM